MINHTPVTNCVMLRKSPKLTRFAAWESISRELWLYKLALFLFFPRHPFTARTFFPFSSVSLYQHRTGHPGSKGSSPAPEGAAHRFSLFLKVDVAWSQLLLSDWGLSAGLGLSSRLALPETPAAVQAQAKAGHKDEVKLSSESIRPDFQYCFELCQLVLCVETSI